jgi:hypothetical protein
MERISPQGRDRKFESFLRTLLEQEWQKNENCIIWLTDDAFVRLGSSSASSLPGVYQDKRI